MGNAVTTKGQVTIPKPIRDILGIGPGSRVTFEVAGNGRVTMRKDDDGMTSARPAGCSRACAASPPRD